jgi:hypothetical protein
MAEATTIVGDLRQCEDLVAHGERLFWAAIDPDTPEPTSGIMAPREPRGLVASARVDGTDLQVHARKLSASTLTFTDHLMVWTSSNSIGTLDLATGASRKLALLPDVLRARPAAIGSDVLIAYDPAAFSSVIARLDSSSGALTTLVDCGKQVLGLNVVGDWMVWYERGGSVRAARRDGSDVRSLIRGTALAIAPLDDDVLVVEKDGLTRVPLEGGPPRRLVDHPCERAPAAVAVTPDAVLLAFAPVLWTRDDGPTMEGASIRRLRLGDGAAATIHALEPGPGKNFMAASFASSLVNGMVTTADAVIFAESGDPRARTGAIRRLPLDAPPLAPRTRSLNPVSSPEQLRNKERERLYAAALGPVDALAPVVARLAPRGSALVQGRSPDVGGEGAGWYTATSGLTNAIAGHEVGFGYELFIRHRERAPWPVTALAWLVEQQLERPDPRAVLGLVDELGGFVAGPLALGDGLSIGFLVAPAAAPLPQTSPLSFGEIRLLQVSTITGDELAFATREGPRQLRIALQTRQLADMSDPHRPSFLAPDGR